MSVKLCGELFLSGHVASVLLFLGNISDHISHHHLGTRCKSPTGANALTVKHGKHQGSEYKTKFVTHITGGRVVNI